jgi:hypothetical protein
MERAVAARLRMEGKFPELDGATAWLNSEPLTPAGLRGKVVVIQFCTFSCVNWLRTLPYVRAWVDKYRDHGLVLIGAHSPEFPFEHDVEKVSPALEAMGIHYPIAIDNEFAVWRAFGNEAWPALYFIDDQGRIRHRHYGEEDYERSERVIQQLLAEVGSDGFETSLVSVEPAGVELAADWNSLATPETYVGYARATGLASSGVEPDRRRDYAAPPGLSLNQWALSGAWTIGEQITTLNEPGGRIAFRFHGRDLNLVLGPEVEAQPVRFRALIDGAPPDGARGIDLDEQGKGTITAARLYQLVRQDGPIADRTFEITFVDAGAQAYVFTFG